MNCSLSIYTEIVVYVSVTIWLDTCWGHKDHDLLKSCSFLIFWINGYVSFGSYLHHLSGHPNKKHSLLPPLFPTHSVVVVYSILPFCTHCPILRSHDLYLRLCFGFVALKSLDSAIRPTGSTTCFLQSLYNFLIYKMWLIIGPTS